MSLASWENQTLNYELSKYPWHEWVLEVIQEIEPLVTDLSLFHTVVPTNRIVQVTTHVQQSFGRREFMERFDNFAAEYLAPLIDHRRYMIKRQATLNLVVPNQTQVGRRLPFHQGVWYNNGRGQRTIWTALTECFDSNSMWVVSTKDSQRISKQTIDQKLNQSEFEDLCLQSAWPVNISPGQSHLFHQEIIHGNVNNDTGVTRMSIDWHLLVEGEEHGRRLPGGFFRFPGDHAQADKNNIKNKQDFVCYVGNNTNYDRHIPHLLQRMLIDRYCNDFGVGINCVQFENEYLHWMPILEQLIEQKVPGIVMQSIYSLPDDADRRKEIVGKALKSGVELHFANEYIQLIDHQTAELVEKYLTFSVASSGPHSWELSI